MIRAGNRPDHLCVDYLFLNQRTGAFFQRCESLIRRDGCYLHFPQELLLLVLELPVDLIELLDLKPLLLKKSQISCLLDKLVLVLLLVLAKLHQLPVQLLGVDLQNLVGYLQLLELLERLVRVVHGLHVPPQVLVLVLQLPHGFLQIRGVSVLPASFSRVVLYLICSKAIGNKE